LTEVKNSTVTFLQTKIKFALQQERNVQSVNIFTALFFFNFGNKCGWVVNATPRLHYPRIYLGARVGFWVVVAHAQNTYRDLLFECNTDVIDGSWSKENCSSSEMNWPIKTKIPSQNIVCTSWNVLCLTVKLLQAVQEVIV